MARRRLTDEEKRTRKTEREIATTLKQMTPEYRARERDMHRKQQARWAKANPDCVAEAQRKWKKKQDPELFREYDAKRYAVNAEKIKARVRARYARNKKRINAKRRAKAKAERIAREALLRPVKKIGPAIMPEDRV